RRPTLPRRCRRRRRARAHVREPGLQLQADARKRDPAVGVHARLDALPRLEPEPDRFAPDRTRRRALRPRPRCPAPLQPRPRVPDPGDPRLHGQGQLLVESLTRPAERAPSTSARVVPRWRLRAARWPHTIFGVRPGRAIPGPGRPLDIRPEG